MSVKPAKMHSADKFYDEEVVRAIIYHDGQYVDNNASVAHREEPLTLLLQYADTWSGFVLGNPQIQQKLRLRLGVPICR